MIYRLLLALMLLLVLATAAALIAVFITYPWTLGLGCLACLVLAVVRP